MATVSMSVSRFKNLSKMPISLHFLELPELVSLYTDSTTVGELTLVEGALPPPFLLEAAVGALKEGKRTLWHSFALFVLQDQRCAVGSGGFMAPPSNRRVELGYGVAESQWGKGFATEGVFALLAIAFAEPEIDEVYAESAVANIASQRVLEKAGFRNIGQRETTEDGLVNCWLIPKWK